MSLIHIQGVHVWLCVRKIGMFKGPEVSEGLMVAGQAG